MPVSDSIARDPRPRLIHSRGLSQLDALAALEAHRRALAEGRGVLKDGRRSAVTRVEVGRRVLCVKEFRSERRGGWRIFSRARRAWRGARRLLRAGVEIPEPLALLERGKSAYLVMRFIEGAASLDRLLTQRFAGQLSPGELAAKRRLLRSLGAWARRVHDRKVYHDDWSPKNILACEDGQHWSFYLLDFDSLAFAKRLNWRRRVKNLGQLNDTPPVLSATDRMRFLVSYAGGSRLLLRGRFPAEVVAYTHRRRLAASEKFRRDRQRKSTPTP